jgi:hypothetical protein
MTTQLLSQTLAPNKRALADALNLKPDKVVFLNVAPSGDHRFTGANILRGETFPCVLDHPKRMRFAQITRAADGRFRVK